jgi:hypothetical protein
MMDRERADIDMLAIVRPGSRGVVGRIVRLADRDDQMPLQRRLLDACDQGIEEVILALRRGLIGRLRLERLGRHHRPANRRRGAGGVDEAERVEAVISGVGEAGREWLGIDELNCSGGLGWAARKAFILAGSGLPA